MAYGVIWCLSQGLPQDGVKRLLVDMEREKGEQEERALQAMQRSTEDVGEAEAKIQNLQVREDSPVVCVTPVGSLASV